MSDLEEEIKRIQNLAASADVNAIGALASVTSITSDMSTIEDRIGKQVRSVDPRPAAGQIMTTSQLVLDPETNMFIDTTIYVLGYIDDAGNLTRRGFFSEKEAIGYKTLLDQD